MKCFNQIGSIMVVVVLAALMLNTDEVQARQDSWDYSKKSWFSVDMTEKCIYWNEECTIYAGSKCAQPGGAFRTCVANFELPKISMPPIKL